MSRGLTTASLRDRIAKSTGLPKHLVAHVLDALIDEMRSELMGQGELHIRGLFRIYTSQKDVVLSADNSRTRRVLLQVRPVRSFRRALNTILPG